MPTDIATVAAASAALDTDLLTVAPQKRTRTSPKDRVLKGIALRGSAATGDAAVDVFIDTFYIGRYYNNNTGFPNNDDLLAVGMLGWPAGAALSAVVADAAATNPLNFMYSWDDLE